jgi:hypothetical protein
MDLATLAQIPPTLGPAHSPAPSLSATADHRGGRDPGLVAPPGGSSTPVSRTLSNGEETDKHRPTFLRLMPSKTSAKEPRPIGSGLNA